MSHHWACAHTAWSWRSCLGSAIALATLTGCSLGTSAPPADGGASASASTPPPLATLTYRVDHLSNSTVHVVTVPPTGAYSIEVVAVDELTPLTEIAVQENAIAAINAGFFDPQNGRTTSHITVDGQLVADPAENERLVNNPDLQPYLDAILNRSEFRVYDCNDHTRHHAIAQHRDPVTPDCRLQAAVGAGPQLLPEFLGYEEAFLSDNATGELVRDALGSQSPNARSAIGIRADGTVVLAIAAQLSQTDEATGLTLSAMAAVLESLGAQQALNLDGGSSTSLYFDGQLYLGRRDTAGNAIARPIKSAIVIRSRNSPDSAQ